MNKFTTIVAMCVFGLMVSASHADEMMPEDGMMKDEMHESMDHNGMKTDDMSDSMEQMMDSDEMPMDNMEMEKEMEMMDKMDVIEFPVATDESIAVYISQNEPLARCQFF